MAVTIHDPAAVAALASTTAMDIEVRGRDGQLLGRFTPAPGPA